MGDDDDETDTSSARVSAAIGRRIRAERQRQGLTAKALGRMTNDMPGALIARYERGYRVIPSSAMFFIAHALGVPIARFFNGIAEDADIGMEVVASPKEAVQDAAELVLHLAKLAAQMETPEGRALLRMLLEQLPGGAAVARATNIPRLKRRDKWHAKIQDPQI